MGSDPLSAIGLVVGSCTLEFWVRFPNERIQSREPGKTPCVKVPVPHGSQTTVGEGGPDAMARNGLRTQLPGVEPMAADGDGRRIPFVSIPHHTLILHARASAQYSLPRPRNGNFAHASRSDSPRNLLELQALHPVQPSALVLYCSDFMLTLSHIGRSVNHRNPTGAQRAASARSWFLIVCCSDCTPASFPCVRPLLPSSDRSAGQRNQPSHSTVLARPVCLFVCVSAAFFSCARSLPPSSGRSTGQRNQPSHSTVLARPVCPFVCVRAASFPCRFTLSLSPAFTSVWWSA
jgi:hypothetical protein